MIKNKNIAFALFVAFFLVFWNILDAVYSVAVAHSTYQFETVESVMEPLFMAVLLGYLLILRRGEDMNGMLKEMRDIEGAVLLDVRSADEYMQGHIPGAVNVPADSISTIEKEIENKDTPIYSYCLAGTRSRRAVRAMKAMGYTNVTNIGGINKYKGNLEK